MNFPTVIQIIEKTREKLQKNSIENEKLLDTTRFTLYQLKKKFTRKSQTKCTSIRKLNVDDTGCFNEFKLRDIIYLKNLFYMTY